MIMPHNEASCRDPQVSANLRQRVPGQEEALVQSCPMGWGTASSPAVLCKEPARTTLVLEMICGVTKIKPQADFSRRM